LPLNSIGFLFVFLPLCAVLFWHLPRPARVSWAPGFLLAASVCFYAVNSLASLLILLPSVILDYGIARLILRAHPARQGLRHSLLIAGVALNILFLGYFKFGAVVLATVNQTLGTSFNAAPAIVPLGISFLVLQKIAFLADVRSGQVKDLSFLEYLVFAFFFPRAIAGPIIHYQEIAPQIRRPVERDPREHLMVGICLICIGVFKKSFVADSLDKYVSPVFSTPSSSELFDLYPTLITSWISLLCYAMQLYFDFSGYSDMAIGTARLFGIRLPMNFNSPFKATSIVEYWSRWHITLTRFLTAYTYTPVVLFLTRRRMKKGAPVLQGKKSKASAILTIVAVPTFITMILSGLWHGVGWQFICWGLLHGFYLTVNQAWKMLRPRFWPDKASYERVMKPVGLVVTFFAVILALVFFRAPSVTSALSIYAGLVGANGVFPETVQLYHAAGVDTPWIVMNSKTLIGAVWWLVVLLPAVMLLPNSLALLSRYQPVLEGELWEGGLVASRLAAIVVAVLGVLGVMTLNQGTGFLYGQF